LNIKIGLNYKIERGREVSLDIVTLIAIASAVGTIASAIVAFYIARLTAKTLNAYKQQVQIGQEQIHATQEQTFHQARPVLVPPTDINGLMVTENGRTFIRWGQGQRTIKGLQNVGVGPAFNIYGVFFGTPLQDTPPSSRYVLWNYGVLSPGAIGPDITLSQGTSVKSETVIHKHVLYVPDDLEHIGCITRLTLTYHDIFGRKFASIYDYQNILGWMCVGHFENIEHDLRELDDQEPTTQQARQFYYQMGKSGS